VILVLLLYALFATIFPLCKLAFDHHIQPIFFTGMRMLLGGGALLIFQFFLDKRKIVWKKEHTWPIIILIVCNIYLTNVCECWGLQYLSSVKTCFIYNLCPFFTAFFSFLFLNERLSKIKWLGFIIGIIGFIPFFIEKSVAETNVGGLFFFSWPEIALVVAALATVFGWIAMRRLVLDGYSPIVANGISMFASAFLIMPTSFFAGESWNPFPVSHWNYALFYIIITTIISNVIAYNMYGWLLNRYTATFLTFAGFASPLFTALFGWLLLTEQVSWTFVFSMVIVFIGLFLFHSEEQRQQRASHGVDADKMKG
jgi:drug/metabolite transporter (DMT)-like permease